MSTSTEAAAKPTIPAGEFSVDPVHSTVGFAVTHNEISTFRSAFKSYEARLVGGESPRLEGTVDVESIDVADEMLKGHLLSPEFFDAERHPKLRFASTALDVAADGTVRLAGELEIRGSKREVRAEGRFAELGEDAQGQARVGLSLGATVDRRDFGLEWQAELPGGGQLLDWTVKIEVELELVAADG